MLLVLEQFRIRTFAQRRATVRLSGINNRGTALSESPDPELFYGMFVIILPLFYS